MANQKRSFFRRYPLLSLLAGFLVIALAVPLGIGIYGAIWDWKRYQILKTDGVQLEEAGQVAPFSRQLGAWIRFEWPTSEVRALVLTEKCDQPGILAQLQAFPELRELETHGGALTAKEGALIARHPKLTTISLYGTDISPEAWDILAAWAARRNVSMVLGVVSTSDHGLEVAARHKAPVVEVNLSGPGVSAKGLAVLSSLPQLQSIRAQYVTLSPADWTTLASVPKLRDLTFKTSSVCDEAMSVLSKLECMRTIPILDLSKSDIGDAGIAGLKQNRVFSEVVIGAQKITPAGVAALGEVPGLTSITIQDQHLDENAILGLSRSPSVYYLTISNGTIDEGGLAALGKCKSVQSLVLTNVKIQPSGAEQMATGYKDRGLQQLTLKQNDLSDDGFAAIAQIKTDSLSLADATVGERGLLALKDNPTLSELNLEDVGASGHALSALGEMKNLRTMTLIGAIADDQALEWVSRQPKMEHLELDRMDFVETLDENTPMEPGKGCISVTALVHALKASPILRVRSLWCRNDPTEMREYIDASFPKDYPGRRVHVLNAPSAAMPGMMGGFPPAGVVPGTPHGTMPATGMPFPGTPVPGVATPSAPPPGTPAPPQ